MQTKELMHPLHPHGGEAFSYQRIPDVANASQQSKNRSSRIMTEG
jgi:hypothetical protein